MRPRFILFCVALTALRDKAKATVADRAATSDGEDDVENEMETTSSDNGEDEAKTTGDLVVTSVRFSWAFN